MYNNFEIEIVAEYNDHHGGTFCEVWHDTVEELKIAMRDGDDIIDWFYTIYGHRDDQGVEALIDISKDNADDAFRVHGWLNELLECKKKLQKIRELT